MTTIRQYMLDAQTAKGQAEQAAQTAGGWAVGEIPGFEQNNSKYYNEASKEEADRAKEEADRATQYAKIVAPGFYFDPETASLYMKSGRGVDFIVDSSDLYWMIAE